MRNLQFVLCLHFTAMKYIPKLLLKLSWRMKSQNIKGEPCNFKGKNFWNNILRRKLRWKQNFLKRRSINLLMIPQNTHYSTSQIFVQKLLFYKSFFDQKIIYIERLHFWCYFEPKIWILGWLTFYRLQWIKVHFLDQNWTFNIVWRCGLSLENAIAQRESHVFGTLLQPNKKK